MGAVGAAVCLRKRPTWAEKPTARNSKSPPIRPATSFQLDWSAVPWMSPWIKLPLITAIASLGPTPLVECARHEALLNLAFAGGQAWWLACPYDTGSLPEAVLAEAERSRVENHVLVANEGPATVHETVNGVPVTRVGARNSRLRKTGG